VDQQLFPLLELVDFRRTTGRWPGSEVWGEEVRQVWVGLPRDDNGLVPGEENPADDPSLFPYLLSSQLLLAYVARRLAEFEDELGTTDLRLGQDAARTLDVVRATFTCPGPFGDQWAYEADGVGGHRLYHDANDVPTALAPLWGLCDASDPHWCATMRFAFSEQNPGFVTGSMSGLGSAHTPGIWPLGDAQEWAVAVAGGDTARVEAVVARITRVASADGMLPETYDAQTGDWLARHWFSWPGSLVGLLHAAFDHGRGPWMAG
jgi:meiotically up-regulated gene 157 (Mug157) protein